MTPVSTQERNKAIVRAGFDRWSSGAGDPFELLAPDVEWTIVGSSPLSKTYYSRKGLRPEWWCNSAEQAASERAFP